MNWDIDRINKALAEQQLDKAIEVLSELQTIFEAMSQRFPLYSTHLDLTLLARSKCHEAAGQRREALGAMILANRGLGSTAFFRPQYQETWKTARRDRWRLMLVLLRLSRRRTDVHLNLEELRLGDGGASNLKK